MASSSKRARGRNLTQEEVLDQIFNDEGHGGMDSGEESDLDWQLENGNEECR